MSLRLRVIVVVLLTELVAHGLVGWLALRDDEARIRAETAAWVQETLRVLAASCAGPLARGDDDALRELVRELASESGARRLEWVAVVDASGTIRAHTDPRHLGHVLEGQDHLDALAHQAMAGAVVEETVDLSSQVAAPIGGPRSLGVVIANVPMAEVQRQLALQRRSLVLSMALVSLGTVVGLLAALSWIVVEPLEALTAAARTDGLTGLLNHRSFQERLRLELRRAAHGHATLALLMLDVDHFKIFNDTYGHPSGDELLRAISGSMRGAVRGSDTVARYGGEEFAVLLPGVSLEQAALVAEKVRAAVGRASAVVEGQPRSATVSIGVALWPEHAVTPGDLVERADRALYEAKRAGRDRVAVASGPASTSLTRAR